MPRDNKTEITGVIKSLHKRSVLNEGKYYAEFTILDDSSRLLPVRYAFPTSALAEAVTDSLRVGLYVTVTLHGQIDGSDAYYLGCGPIHFLQTAPAPRPPHFDSGIPPHSDGGAAFTPTERKSIRASIEQAKADIHRQFRPTNTQMHKVEERLDELARKIDTLSKFDWSKLFVSSVIGISVDLGCGSTVPETLLNLFKNLFSGIIEQQLLTNKTP
jgi:hypothetical protein